MTKQLTKRMGGTLRTASWRSRLTAAAAGMAILIAGSSGLSALATGSIGGDGRGGSVSLAQASRCGIPTATDRAPLDDGTAGGGSIPGLATPVAADGATPDSSPADPSTLVDIDLVIRAVAACLTAGDYQTVTDLASAEFLGTLAGVGGQLDPATYLLLAENFPVTPFRVRSIDTIQVTGDDQATADVVYAIANQLFRGRWTFTQVATGSDATGGVGAGRWIIAAEQPLEPEAPEDAVEIDVTLDEYEITLDPDTAAGQDVVFSAENTGEAEHEILILRVESGGDVQDLLTEPGPALPAGLTFAGQLTIPAGSDATLPLVGLQPGAYALVSLLLDADGVSDLAQGMQAELTVTE